MTFDDYQRSARSTDLSGGHSGETTLIAILGLAGEVGSLASAYKKMKRDGAAHARYREEVVEDLGDLLWYAASTATSMNISLREVAEANLAKTASRWGKAAERGDLFSGSGEHLFDVDFPLQEQFPRLIEVELEEVRDGESVKVIVSRDGKQIGDALTDNAPDDDGYRFHDVFHLSYAAVLGWSPIARKLLRVKRKSDTRTDTVEDGARAAIIEELISQLVFQYAREHNFLDGVKTLDHHLLKTIHSLVQDREVRARTLYEWESAILSGYGVWRQVRAERRWDSACGLVA